jgi:N-acetylmuramoyl-L-alanine amidase
MYTIFQRRKTMPKIYLSPSTQEFNPYVTGGSEEYYMNLIADALEPYLVANGIEFTRNSPSGDARASIRESNAGDYDLHLALHSNASNPENAGENQGIDVYYYPGSQKGREASEIFVDNFKDIYPLPNKVRLLTTTRLGEVRQTRAPSAFLEIGYHDNTDDANWIVKNIPEIARNIAISLTDYFGIPFKEPDLTKRARVSTSSGNLNLRSAPSISAPVIASIPAGTILDVTDGFNGWYKTVYNGATGYVSASYINII